jgi:hypothetical protein
MMAERGGTIVARFIPPAACRVAERVVGRGGRLRPAASGHDSASILFAQEVAKQPHFGLRWRHQMATGLTQQCARIVELATH